MPLDPYSGLPLDPLVAERQRIGAEMKRRQAELESQMSLARNSQAALASGVDLSQPAYRAQWGLRQSNDINLDGPPQLDARRNLEPRQMAPWEVPSAKLPEFSPEFSDVSSGASTTAIGRLPDMEGVISGASSTAGPSVGQLPPPPPLRYNTGDGWQEFQSGQEPSRGTFSMMTAPENAGVVTQASRLEDAEYERRIREAQDPYEDERAVAGIRTDEAIRLAEAQDRISMSKQYRLQEEQKQIQMLSDNQEQELAGRYGVDLSRDPEGTSLDEERRQQYSQEREALKRQVGAQMTVLLSRYGMAPRTNAGYEALSQGF
jgi:hypothetical protein